MRVTNRRSTRTPIARITFPGWSGIDPGVIRHALAPVVPAAAAALDLPRTLRPGAGGVALTFDDGPHPEGTPAMLEVLARAGARATFFVVGEQVRAPPGARRPRSPPRATLVALHGYRHRLQLRLSAAAVARRPRARARRDRGRDAASRPAGTARRTGSTAPPGCARRARPGCEPLLWSRWGKDWRKFTTPARIAAPGDARASAAGDVILLHDADFYSARDSHRAHRRGACD